MQDNIADTHEYEQVLKGIQPKNQRCYKVFKFCRLYGIFALILFVLLFALTLFKGTQNFITKSSFYRIATLGVLGISVFLFLIMFLVRALFLRKAPFDDWVFEIAEKNLNTKVIFYNSRYLFINYNRGGKEMDKKDFVTEMSDKSEHYSYYLIKTFIDQGFIQVECKKREPIPTKASWKTEDDIFWNVIPLGLVINTVTQKISPRGWYLNDQNINEELFNHTPSTSILIVGGTGCYSEDTPIRMYNSLV